MPSAWNASTYAVTGALSIGEPSVRDVIGSVAGSSRLRALVAAELPK